MMGGGYGPGYGMMSQGYGPGWMMGPGYGPGMMYGYGPDGRGYQRGPAYRGKRLSRHLTDAQSHAGYYEPCAN